MFTHNIMQPVIYKLPTTENKIKLKPVIETDIYPSPKLIKYGFNQLSDRINMVELTKNDHYRAGLNFDFTRADPIWKETFGIKVDQDFCIFWEIMDLFGMLNLNQTVISNISTTINQIFTAFNKLAKKKLTSKAHEKLPAKEKITVFIQKYSDIDLTEDNMVMLILTDMIKMLDKQSNPGSSAILQIFSIQTTIMTELIYYLGTLYDEAYIMKPLASSDLSDEKYLILNGLKKGAVIFDLPKMKQNSYLHTLNLDLPSEFTEIIQCINAEIMPQKYITYLQVETFLANKVYEGATYQEMIQKQNDNVQNWIKIYTDLTKSESFLEQVLDQSSKVCVAHREIHWE